MSMNGYLENMEECIKIIECKAIELEKEGKEVQLFAMTDITNERLRNFKGIDAFIQVACPRISTDNQFDKPVLSTPQANALLKILRKESIEGYLEIPHWL